MRGPFFDPTAWLYYVCFLLLAALLLLIALRGRSYPRRYKFPYRRRPTRPDTPHHQRCLRRTFLMLAFSLGLWQLTLFAETRTASPVAWLWLGRLNFAAMVFAPYFALRFVGAVAGRLSSPSCWICWCRAETLLLATMTLLTPWIDAAERVENGQAISTYGVLFPLYIAHVALYWLAAPIVALRERSRADNQTVRDQLTLIGGGMLTTGTVALVANVLLPYGFGNFRWCDAGALSTLLFLLAIAYATLWKRLFDLRILVREALVYGLLLAFVLGGYSSAVFVISQYLTTGAGVGTQFAVLLIAFSFDPLRRWLEKETDRLLFGERCGADKEPPRGRKRGGSRRTLALVFPWWRP